MKFAITLPAAFRYGDFPFWLHPDAYRTPNRLTGRYRTLPDYRTPERGKNAVNHT